MITVEKTWSSGPNAKFPVNSKVSDHKHLFGSLNIPAHLELPEKTMGKPRAAVPASFDPRTDQGAAWGVDCPSITEIRDQSACGSCWAFGAASAMSDRFCIHSAGNHQASLSTEDLLSCCKTCGMGCNGGYTSQTWTYMQTHGLCTGGLFEGEGCKPYTLPPCEHHTDGVREDCSNWDFDTPACSSQCVNSYAGPSYNQDKVQNKDAYKVPRTINAIKQELYENGPVEASFTVYDDFMSYTGGVYYHTKGRSLGGHAVKMMGWGTDADSGLDYWLIANSWNSDWAEDGYFRIRMGTNECGIEGGLYAGMPNIV